MIIPPASNASLAWYALLKTVVEQGYESSPRGKDIYEVLGTQILFNMENPVVAVSERRLSYSFMAAEALWILSGSNKVSDIEPWCDKLKDYSDDGRIFFGAYGPPIKEQTNYVCNKLLDDPDTRQAVMTIWRQNPPQSKDIPCTLSLQFIIRGQQIFCIVNMRSSDVWLGLPYDMFVFTAVSIAVARRINFMRGSGPMVTLGSCMLTAGSSHVYKQDLQKIEEYGIMTLDVIRKLASYNYSVPADMTIPCRCNDCRRKLIYSNDHDMFELSLRACRDKKEEEWQAPWKIRP
jgi:thymidylate synthase